MAAEIPQNEVRTKKLSIAGPAAMLAVVNKLITNPNVVRIEISNAYSGFEVIAHYAVMDLALQLASIDCEIEKLADETQKISYVTQP